MALGEIALISLAWNLAANPTTIDIKNYQSLSEVNQKKVRQIIEKKDFLPKEFESLRERGQSPQFSGDPDAPTAETSSGN